MPKRNPGFAGILNFFFWGTGYAYTGIANPSGVPWPVWTIVLAIFNVLVEIYGLAVLVFAVPFSVFLSYDAFKKCRNLNRVSVSAQAQMPTISNCPNCSVPISPGDEFCPNCGRRIQLSASSALRESGRANLRDEGTGSTSQLKKCPECGRENPSTYNFCKKCGAKLT